MLRKLSVPALIGLVVVVGILIFVITRTTSSHIGSSNHRSTSLVSQAALEALPHKSASSADISHLGSKLVPPTNSWFSGMVLQKNPEPVYPMPISFLANNAGFELGLPSISSSATQISGSHTPGLVLDNAADSFLLSRYDKLSATLTYSKAIQKLGTATVTEGSPFVFYSALSEHRVTIANVTTGNIQERTEHYVRYFRDGKTYALVSTTASISMLNGAINLTLEPGNLLTTYALPSSDDSLRPYANNQVESSSVSQSLQKTTSTTKLGIKTLNRKPTVLAAMPYTKFTGKPLASYPSIWGDMKIYGGTSFTVTVPRIAPANELELSKISTDQKQQIITSLKKDSEATAIDAQDSYYAGKQLARAANLLSIAEQLGESDIAKQLSAKINQGFTSRLGTDFFYYDTRLKGIAASKAAFGSEDFNDHHFHYGYWLYAGSILAKYDSSFLKQHTEQLNLLAADIASPNATGQFPAYRNYDPYAGHGWAAGLAPFSDGNNQESSSEAIHAWNGAALWGQVTKNTELENVSEWMLANESNTAAQAWRHVDVSSKALGNYAAPIASLNFGGKRTYDTFFSAEPSAKLGIQLIPMDPSMQEFRSDKATIETSINKTVQSGNYNVALGDYMLMYLALTNAPKAHQLLAKQTMIDDGNSLSYLRAFIYLQQ